MRIKKIWSVIASTALVASALVAQSVPAQAVSDCAAGGSGVSDDPYVICSFGDWMNLSNAPSETYFRLGQDLDFVDSPNYVPFAFNGVLDGNNHTVRNLSSAPADQQGGVFSTLRGAVIQNIRFQNLSISGSNTTDVAAFADFASNTTLTNIDISGKVTSMPSSNQQISDFLGLVSGSSQLSNIRLDVSIETSGMANTISAGNYLGTLGYDGNTDEPSFSKIVSLSSVNGDGTLFRAGTPVQLADNTYDCSTSTDIFQLGNYNEYFVSDTDPQCGAPTTRTELAALNSNGMPAWYFGNNRSLPFLQSFPDVPGPAQGVVIYGAASNQIYIAFEGPDEFGSGIPVRVDLQIRTSNSSWYTPAQYVDSGNGFFVVSGETPNQIYYARVRFVSSAGFGDWGYTNGGTLFKERTNDPSTYRSTPQIGEVQSLDADTSVIMGNAVSLGNGNVAYLYALRSNGDSGSLTIYLDYLTPTGVVLRTLRLKTYQDAVDASYYISDRNLKLIAEPNGGLAAAYVLEVSDNGDLAVDTVNVINVSPTTQVSNSIQVGSATNLDFSTGICNRTSFCGLEELDFQIDGSGNHVLSISRIAVFTDSTVKTEYSYYQAGPGQYAAWSAKKTVTPIGTVDNLSVQPLKTGFAFAWTDHTTTKISIAILKKLSATISAPISFADTGSIGRGQLVTRFKDKTLSFVWYNQQYGAVQLRDFDIKKSKWAKANTYIGEDDGFGHQFSASSNGLGKVNVIWTAGGGTWPKIVYSNSIEADNTLDVQYANQMGFGSVSYQDYGTVKSVTLPGGMTYAVWQNCQPDLSHPNCQATLTATSGYFLDRNSSQLPTSFALNYGNDAIALSSGQLLTFSRDGGMYSNTSSLTAVGVTLPEAPQPQILPTVIGVARVGINLTTKLPYWQSMAPIQSQSTQWYQCSQRVNAAATTLDSSCTAIKKATKATFKAAKAQKGKYLLRGFTATNFYGTATWFTPSTTAVN